MKPLGKVKHVKLCAQGKMKDKGSRRGETGTKVFFLMMNASNRAGGPPDVKQFPPAMDISRTRGIANALAP